MPRGPCVRPEFLAANERHGASRRSENPQASALRLTKPSMLAARKNGHTQHGRVCSMTGGGICFGLFSQGLGWHARWVVALGEKRHNERIRCGEAALGTADLDRRPS